jgi:hypothetical protein
MPYGKQDVTSDFLKCIVDRFSTAKDATIRSSDGTIYNVSVTLKENHDK